MVEGETGGASRAAAEGLGGASRGAVREALVEKERGNPKSWYLYDVPNRGFGPLYFWWLASLIYHDGSFLPAAVYPIYRSGQKCSLR